MLVARHCINCVHARPQGTLITQTHDLFRQRSLFLSEKLLVAWIFV